MAAKKSKRAKRVAPRQVKPPAASRGKLTERALGPAADEFGNELAPLGKEVGSVSLKVGRMLLLPIKGLVGGLERIGTWLGAAVTDRLKNVPDEKIVEPSARIAVPTVQALVYSMDDDLIRELFANLLATDMNADKKSSAHPAFVEMIRQMTPQDARVFLRIMESPEYRYDSYLRGGNQVHFGDTEFSFELDGMDRHQIAYSLDNLQRLALVELNPNRGPVGERYDEKRKAAGALYDSMAQAFSERREAGGPMGMSGPFSKEVKLNGIYATGFGVEFWKACMNDRDGGAVIPKSVKSA